MRGLRGRTPSRSSRTGIICATILFVLVAILVCSQTMLWTGGYPLAVTLETGGREPDWVYCVTAQNREEFEPLMNEPLTPELVRRWHDGGILLDPYRGETLNPYVRLGGRRSWILGELVDPQQDKVVLIIAAWADGESRRRIIDIPDYRKTKRMTADLR